MANESLPVWPFERGHPLHPPPEFAQRRSSCPVGKIKLWDGSEPWLVTRYDDIRKTLNDPAISSDITRPGFPTPNEAIATTRGSHKTIVRMDPPAHTRHRRMLTGDFMLKKVATMRPYVESLVTEMLTEMEEGPNPTDLVVALAQRVPAVVVCGLLDLPPEHSEFFQARISTAISLDSTPEESQRANADVVSYFAELIEARTADLGADLVSKLIVEQVLPGDLSTTELKYMLHFLVTAGFDTTANVIALGTVTMLEHPDELQKVMEDSSLWPSAVEELLRFLSVAHHTAFRQSTTEMRIGSQEIGANEGIVLPLASGNRDPERFTDPDRLDVSRDSRGHLAFGFGLHQCLGQSLARLELELVFRQMFERFPRLRLAQPMETLRYKNALIYGVEELPVAW